MIVTGVVMVVPFALGILGAIDAHPWIGGQLARPPWQSTMLQKFEHIGRQVQALGAPAGYSRS